MIPCLENFNSFSVDFDTFLDDFDIFLDDFDVFLDDFTQILDDFIPKRIKCRRKVKSAKIDFFTLHSSLFTLRFALCYSALCTLCLDALCAI